MPDTRCRIPDAGCISSGPQGPARAGLTKDYNAYKEEEETYFLGNGAPRNSGEIRTMASRSEAVLPTCDTCTVLRGSEVATSNQQPAPCSHSNF